MGKTIVAGYDPRTLDRTPVRFAVRFARLTGARLIVAAVEAASAPPPVPAGRAGPVTPLSVDDDLVADCAEAVETLERDLGATGIDVDCRRLRGTSAARALHEAADAEDAALLVVGSSRHGAAGRVLMGSTATRLVPGAPCPVTVVPRGWVERDGIATIGVAYVDSDEARAALRDAHALARRAGATLRVLSVVKVTPAMLSETEAATPPRPAKDLTDVEGEHVALTERALRGHVAALSDDVPVAVDVFTGDPAEVLIDVSANLDLLFCGSRGYGPLRAVMLGSVSRRIAGEACCPVIVLPRGARSSLQELLEQTAAGAARS